MLICREYENCANPGFDCSHNKPHTLEQIDLLDETSCITTPCSCQWAFDNHPEGVYCVEQFIIMMEKAIVR